jgi:hypothetical protein
MKFYKLLFTALFLFGSIHAYAVWNGTANFSNVNVSNLSSNNASFGDNFTTFDTEDGPLTVSFSNKPDSNTDKLAKLTAAQIQTLIKQAIAKDPTQAAILAEALVARVPAMAAVVTFAAVQASPQNAAAIAKAVTTAVPDAASYVASAAIKADTTGSAQAIAAAVNAVPGVSSTSQTQVNHFAKTPQLAFNTGVLTIVPKVNPSVLDVGNTALASGVNVGGANTVNTLIDVTAISASQ